MKVGGEYTFEGPQQMVWETLLDPTVLASVLPGCEKLELVGEDEYEGALKIKVGPVQGQFMGKVKLEDIQPPDSYTMQVDGRGAPGFVKATGHLKLQADGANTQVTYEGEAQVGGRLASVGQRLMESSAKAIIKQSLDGLNAAVKSRGSAAAAGVDAPPPPKVEAPSQAEFAATIAKEVAKDLIPPWLRYAIGAAVAVGLAYLVYTLIG
ncbi:MAG: carbon monoxide dehydrogenase subunit G [Gemmatimonadota bacterium]|nr:carbon monoxide dehydrogenase subunit G [Gemmatimonadota bacterium]MDH5758063.1 carbon monoxide dehydrogenase subunit G [Gemmatimonadota bacterium]